MAGFKDLSTGAKSALLAGSAAIVAIAGYGGWVVNRAPVADRGASIEQAAEPAKIAPTATQTATASDTSATPPAAVDPAKTESAPSAAIAEIEHSTPIIPNFDVVRIEPDGSAVVAGKAEPGSKIVLRVDGVEISATTADADGNFVGLFVLDSSQEARLLTMTSILPDQSEVAATADVALAPTQAPVAIASAEPTPTNAETPIATANSDLATVAEAPAALLITKDGVKVLQSGEPSDVTVPAVALTIDTISYTPAGDVQLAGIAAPGAFLRIYLDNAPLLDLQSGEDGNWVSTLPPIAPGIYTLRVDQLGADGKVTSRFETPFKRETQDALAAATQTPNAVVEGAEVAEPAIVASAEPTLPETAPVAAPAPEAIASAEAEPAAVAKTVAVAEAPPAPNPAPPVSITVQPGFTLWGIASQQFGDGVMYVQVFEANKDKIRDPNLIYPGQVFVIPTASE